LAQDHPEVLAEEGADGGKHDGEGVDPLHQQLLAQFAAAQQNEEKENQLTMRVESNCEEANKENKAQENMSSNRLIHERI